jgi:hypothetical protein
VAVRVAAAVQVHLEVQVAVAVERVELVSVIFTRPPRHILTELPLACLVDQVQEVRAQREIIQPLAL